MRVLVLLVVLFACHVSCQQTILKKGSCTLNNEPPINTFLRLKKDDFKDHNKAKLTIKGDAAKNAPNKVFDLNLKNLTNDFFLFVDLGDLTENCDVDINGVSFELLADAKVKVGEKVTVVGPVKDPSGKIEFERRGKEAFIMKAKTQKNVKMTLKTRDNRYFDVFDGHPHFVYVPPKDLQQLDTVDVTFSSPQDLENYHDLENIAQNDFKLPMDSELHFQCTYDLCPLPLEKQDIFLHLSVQKNSNQVEVKINKIDLNVTPDESLIRKISKNADVTISKGKVFLKSASTSDKYKVSSTKLTFFGPEGSGELSFEQTGIKKFSVKAEEPTDLFLTITNEYAQKPEDIELKYQFEANKLGHFYFPEIKERRLRFRVKTEGQAKVVITREDIDEKGFVKIGTGDMKKLTRNEVGVITRPAKGEKINLRIELLNTNQKDKVKAKFGSKSYELLESALDIRTIDEDDFERQSTLILELEDDAEIKLTRIDNPVPVEFKQGKYTILDTQPIELDSRGKGYTLYVNNNLERSDSATFELNTQNFPRKIAGNSIQEVFIYHEDIQSLKGQPLKGKLVLGTNKQIFVESKRGIQKIDLRNGEYYVRNNIAILQTTDFKSDYNVAFELLDDSLSKELTVEMKDKKFILSNSNKNYVQRLSRRDHNFNEVEFNFRAKNGLKDAHIRVKITELSEGEKDCTTSPCKNGGKCWSLDGGGIRCECVNGFQGDLCERKDKDSGKGCTTSPCKNGGKCRSLEGDGIRCECVKGFQGDLCERKDEDASDNSSPHVKAAVWVIVGVVSLAFLMN